MTSRCILQDVRIGADYIGAIEAKNAFDRGARTSEIVATAWSLANLPEPDADAEETARRLCLFILDCAAHAIEGEASSDAETLIRSARDLVETDVDALGKSLDMNLGRWAYGSKFDAAWSTACMLLKNCFEGADDCRDPVLLAQICAGAGRREAEAAWQDQRLMHWLLAADPQSLPIAGKIAATTS
jgi:hypothetical protein